MSVATIKAIQGKKVKIRIGKGSGKKNNIVKWKSKMERRNGKTKRKGKMENQTGKSKWKSKVEQQNGR